MTIKILVFEGNSSVFHYLWHVCKRNNSTLFLTVNLVEEMGPGAIIDFGGFYDNPIPEITWTRKIFGKVGKNSSYKNNPAKKNKGGNADDFFPRPRSFEPRFLGEKEEFPFRDISRIFTRKRIFLAQIRHKLRNKNGQ